MKMVFSNVPVKVVEIQKNEYVAKTTQINVLNNTETIQSMQWNMIGRLMYSRTCKSCQK
jgi:hypothetical protein